MQIKRRTLNFSIKRHMQVRLFIKIFCISVAASGLMAAIFYFYSNREINNSYKQFHVHAQNFLDFLLPAVVISLLLTIVLSAAVTLFLPIKIAGPLYRIERDLKEKVAHGDLSIRFTLRPGDEGGDLANAVNICLESLGQKIATIRKSAEDLAAITEGKRPAGESELKRLSAEINEEMGKFKLKG